jgi:ABC-type multidrug transport system ATPase subunit
MNANSDTLVLDGVAVDRGGRRVLADVSLSIRGGEIMAVIGPNGAGKTTLLETIIGAIPVSAGSISFGGHRLLGLRERSRAFSFLAGEAEPPAEVRVPTLLDHACASVTAAASPDAPARKELERRLGLAALGDAPAGALSRGERRRILLFGALISAKPFLLLDEPTGVFDPLQLRELVTLFRERAAAGTGFLVTVHQMSDAEAIADRFLLLSDGRAIACDTLDGLRARAHLPPTAALQQVFVALLQTDRARKGTGGASA